MYNLHKEKIITDKIKSNIPRNKNGKTRFSGDSSAALGPSIFFFLWQARGGNYEKDISAGHVLLIGYHQPWNCGP